MSSIGTGYDQSTTTFSPDGRVFQVEYAAKAVDNSSTAVGIRCNDGVVMAVEKPKLSKMMLEGSNRRIMHVDKHSGICISGMIADARQIVNHARYEASRYRDFYGGNIPGQTLCDRIAGLMHNYTLYWYARATRTRRPRSCAVGGRRGRLLLHPGAAPLGASAARALARRPPPSLACVHTPTRLG